MKRSRNSKFLFLAICVVVIVTTLWMALGSQQAEAETSHLPSYYSILDDYYLLNKNQSKMGLCWDFASTRSVETLYAKHLNEYISLSEAGYAFYTKEVGSGSPFSAHHYAMSRDDDRDDDEKEGFTYFENQFPYELLFYANGDPRKTEGTAKRINSYLSKLKLKGLGEMIEPVRISGKNKVEKIKQHIYHESSVFYEIKNYIYKLNTLNSGETVNLEEKKPSANEDHAISLIGFDDEYKYEFKGKTYKGAFIGMNSNSYHKGDSVVYVPYKYVENADNQLDVAGYRFVNKGEQVISERGPVDYVDNKIVNKNNSSVNFVSEQGKFKNNNIFTKNQKINITYTVPESDSLNLKITDGNKDVTDKFDLDISGNRISVIQKEDNSLASKSYNVKIEYNKSGQKHVQYRQLHIVDFAEFLTTNSSNNHLNMTAYQHVDSEKPITVINKEPTKGTLTLKPTLYSEIKEYNFDGKGDKPFVKENGEAKIEIPFDEQKEQVVYKKIVFTLNDNSKVERVLRLVWIANEKTTFAGVFGRHYGIKDKYVRNYPDILVPISYDATSEYSKLDVRIFGSGADEQKVVQLIDKDGNKETINIDEVGRFKKFNSEADLNKYKYQETNRATSRMSLAERRQYQYVFFLDFQHNFTFDELGVEIKGKTNYTALDEVKLDDYEVTVTNGDPSNVTLLRVLENKVEYNTKQLTFFVKYQGTEYKVVKGINVSKKQLEFDNSQLLLTLRYNGQMQNFARGNDTYEFINSKQKDIGSYQVGVSHKDKNFTFADGDIHYVTCTITEPEVEIVEVIYNKNLQTEDVVSIEKVTAKINGQTHTITENITVNYPTGTHAFATTKKVKLVFNFYDYQIKYQLNIIVQKKKIEIPKYIKEYEYSGKEISPTYTNKYYSTVADKGLNAGEYSITFEISDKDNYVFANEKNVVYGKYKIIPIDPKYTFEKGKFDFEDGLRAEYFDEKDNIWKEYNKEKRLEGKVRMRVKGNKNYNEITLDFGKLQYKKKKTRDNKNIQTNTKLSKGAIAGITISIVALIGIAVTIVVILRKKDKEKGKK